MRNIITFLIQTVNGEVVHDFAFTLIEAIKYHNWFTGEKQYEYIFSENYIIYDISNLIPIGSVEFVLEYLQKCYGIDNVKPINIPTELAKPEYLKRQYTNTIENNLCLINGRKVFIKSMDKIKGYTDIIDITKVPRDGNYTVSELIDINSEWRTFIFDGKIVGLQNYGGDFTLFPNVDTIKNMIQDYTSAPLAYTLDVGINKKDGTFIIECHDFFSCGLYGFADYKILPAMFISSWNKLIKKESKLI